MKKIKYITVFSFLLSIIITFSMINIGCYNADQAVVRLKINNLPISKQSLSDKIFSFFVKNAHAQTFPPTDVTAIHLAALKGDSIICVKKIDIEDVTTVGSSSYVEFSVPAGNDITILVVGEDVMDDLGQPVPGFAGYYGYVTIDLVAGATNEISISISTPKWSYGGTTPPYITTVTFPTHIISWDNSGVRTKYHLLDSSDNVLYEGYNTEAVVPTGTSTFKFYVEFEMFNLITSITSFSDT